MAREEEFDQYKNLAISKAQEQQWAIGLAEKYFQNLKESVYAHERIHWMVDLYLIIVQYQMNTELQLLMDYFVSNKENIGRFECLIFAERCIESLNDNHFSNLNQRILEVASSLLATVNQREYSFPEGESEEGSNLETLSENAMNNRIKYAEAKMDCISKTLA